MPKGDDLSHKEAAFVREYLANGGNGTQAAISAGYSEASAAELSSRLLRKVKIRKALGLKLKKAELSVDWVLKRLRKEASGKGVPDTTQGGRVSALSLVAKIQGYVVDKAEVSGPDGGPLQINVIEYRRGEDE